MSATDARRGVVKEERGGGGITPRTHTYIYTLPLPSIALTRSTKNIHARGYIHIYGNMEAYRYLQYLGDLLQKCFGWNIFWPTHETAGTCKFLSPNKLRMVSECDVLHKFFLLRLQLKKRKKYSKRVKNNSSIAKEILVM